jgi:hypothetical protein
MKLKMKHNMDTKEKIDLAKQILNNGQIVDVKMLKTDNSIIEKKMNSIILTDDNRELLRD